jgi:dipeptidase
LSLFKPFYFGTTSLTNHKLLSPNSKSDTSLWWNQRRIIKRANCDYTTTKQILKETIGNFEEATIERAVTLNTLKDKDEFQKERLESHYKLQNQIIQALEERKVSTTKWTSPLFSIYWKIQNAKAGI